VLVISKELLLWLISSQSKNEWSCDLLLIIMVKHLTFMGILCKQTEQNIWLLPTATTKCDHKKC